MDRKEYLKKYNKEYYWKNPEYYRKRVKEYYWSLSLEERKKKNRIKTLNGKSKLYYLKKKERKHISDYFSTEHRKKLSLAKLGKKGELSNGWHGGSIVLKCKYCGKEFQVIKARRNKAKFCSYSCSAKYYVKSKLHSRIRIRQGINLSRYNKEFQAIRKEILKRDKICFLTNEESNLVVHHIDYNKENNSEENLITLGRQIHSKTNFNREFWKSFFQSQMSAIIHLKGKINHEPRYQI